MIQLKQETRADWYVVTVTGRADAEAADILEMELRMAAGLNDKVAVDLSGVQYISSAGLRALLQGARAAQNRNSEFAVCAPSAPVKKVFDMTGMGQLMRIEEALPC